MRKCLGLGVLIVGAIVGAGFASGKEIVVFLGSGVSPFIAPLIGLCFFLLSVLFLSIGNLLKKSSVSDVNAVLMGKFHFLADIFLLLNSLVVLAGMLSAMDTLLNLICPLAPLYSILSGVISAVVVSKGLRAIVKCNVFIVPLTIITIIIICFFNISGLRNFSSFSSYSIGAAVLYVSMNMMLACSFFVTISRLKTSTIIIGSAIAATILTLLILLLIFAINSGDVDGYAMPTLELAKRVNKLVLYFAVVVIAASIFTTMLTAMSTLKSWVLASFGGGEVFSISVVLIAGLIVSNLGFENVVGYLYPIIGFVGIVYIIISIVALIRISKNPCKRLNTSNLL